MDLESALKAALSGSAATATVSPGPTSSSPATKAAAPVISTPPIVSQETAAAGLVQKYGKEYFQKLKRITSLSTDPMLGYLELMVHPEENFQIVTESYLQQQGTTLLEAGVRGLEAEWKGLLAADSLPDCVCALLTPCIQLEFVRCTIQHMQQLYGIGVGDEPYMKMRSVDLAKTKSLQAYVRQKEAELPELIFSAMKAYLAM